MLDGVCGGGSCLFFNPPSTPRTITAIRLSGFLWLLTKRPDFRFCISFLKQEEIRYSMPFVKLILLLCFPNVKLSLSVIYTLQEKYFYFVPLFSFRTEIICSEVNLIVVLKRDT